MYYDDYDDYGRSRRWKMIAAIAVGLLLAALALWKLWPDSGSKDAAATVADTEVHTPIVSVTSTDAITIARIGPTSTIPTTTTVPTTATTIARSGAPEAASSTTGVLATTVAGPAPADSPLGYPTGADGLPLPLVVIFDTNTITISGQLPSQATRDRILALAKANSQFPDVQVVDNLIINPAVPISVGVRVIELNSARFPEGSTTILPAHALELDRVVAIMKALPNISAVVVGHADQRGDDVTNFAISDARARAVVNYLFFRGVSPYRLSSRAAGATDLLTIGNDAAALALNRRTEFIFYGLLIP